MGTDAIVAVFTRAPVRGAVKTRLVSALGEQGALDAHVELLHRTLDNLRAVETLAAVEVWYAGDADAMPVCRYPLRPQAEGDLGQRMLAAVVDITARGAIAVIVGTDCPLLDATYVGRAVAAVRRGADVVLGPAEDGGYVLIAMARAHAALFTDMPWGTSAVLSETVRRATVLELHIERLAELWDVDVPEDWARYLEWRSD